MKAFCLHINLIRLRCLPAQRKCNNKCIKFVFRKDVFVAGAMKYYCFVTWFNVTYSMFHFSVSHFFKILLTNFNEYFFTIDPELIFPRPYCDFLSKFLGNHINDFLSPLRQKYVNLPETLYKDKDYLKP